MAGVLDVARQEVARYQRLTDRRLLVVVLVLGIAIGGVWPIAQDRGVHPDRDLYTVDVDRGSPMAAVVDSDPALRHADEGQTPDVRVISGLVTWNRNSDKSKAAADRLEQAAQAYMDEAMLDEEDQGAAFPVRVDLTYEARELTRQPGNASSGDDASDGGGSGANDSQETDNQTPEDLDPAAPGNGTQAGDSQGPVTPADVTPPFPMKSLLYTFAYLVPLTFVGELYGGSVFAERVKGRGRVLLAAPISRTRLALGKSLPYVGVTTGIAAVVTLVLGAGWTGMVASLPIIGFALAGAFLIGTLAPSQRALTFGLVSLNVLLATFLFLPALFTQIPPISFLSPVGLIAASIRGDPVGLGHLAYGTLPLAAVTGVLAGVGASQFREETMFAPGGVGAKLVDGLDHLLTTRGRLLAAGALAVPIALALELFVLVFAVTLGLTAAFVAFLVGAAFVEEALKGVAAYAPPARPGGPAFSPWTIGPVVGLGFFLGEKAMAALSLFGFDMLPRGTEAMATFGVAGGPWLVLAPLALHVLGPTLVALAADRGRSWSGAALAAAAIVHAVYNATVIALVGGGIPT